jgi:hypothetical protein
MNLGRELVACALRTGDLRPFTEGGITYEWLTSQEDVSKAAVFGSEDLQAWFTLVRYQEQHGKVPTVDMFRRSHPEVSYKLPESSYEPDELLGIFREDRRRYLTHTAVSDLADMIGNEQIDDAVELMVQAARLIRETYTSRSVEVVWDSPDYDFEARINREIKQGIMTGIPGLDKQFNGHQPGNLVCYLGRAKAGKSSFALLSAMNAWEDGKRVLFLSFEIAAGKLPSEPGIADRLDCFGAGIDLIHYMMGELTREEQELLREFHKNDPAEGNFRIIQPTGRYTVADLEADIDRHKPDVVYVDGFYFMTDAETGKSGAHWEGHDNLANDLKKLAMNQMIPVIITHQVREKQLTGKKGKGIDDGAMMGGTAITMFADLVLGVDADEEGRRTVSCTRARLRYLTTVYGTWNWSDCTFTEQSAPVDEEKYAYGRDDDGDTPF